MITRYKEAFDKLVDVEENRYFTINSNYVQLETIKEFLNEIGYTTRPTNSPGEKFIGKCFFISEEDRFNNIVFNYQVNIPIQQQQPYSELKEMIIISLLKSYECSSANTDNERYTSITRETFENYELFDISEAILNFLLNRGTLEYEGTIEIRYDGYLANIESLLKSLNIGYMIKEFNPWETSNNRRGCCGRGQLARIRLNGDGTSK